MKIKQYLICLIMMMCLLFTSCNFINNSEFIIENFDFSSLPVNPSPYAMRKIPVVFNEARRFIKPAIFLDDDNLLMSGSTFDTLYRYNISADEYIEITTAENITLPDLYESEKEDSPIFLSATGFSDYHFIEPNHYFIIDSNHNRVVEIQNDVIIDIIDVMKVWNKPDFTADGSPLYEFDYNPVSQTFVVVTADKQAYLTDRTFASFERIVKAGAYVLDAAWLDESTIFLQQCESVTDDRGVEQYEGLFMAEYNIKTGTYVRLDNLPYFRDILRQNDNDYAISGFGDILLNTQQRKAYTFEQTDEQNIQLRNHFAFVFDTEYKQNGKLAFYIYNIKSNSCLANVEISIDEGFINSDYDLSYSGLISKSGNSYAILIDYSPYKYEADLFIFNK